MSTATSLQSVKSSGAKVEEPCCRECVFTAKHTKYFVGVRHKADRPYPEFQSGILPTPDRQAPLPLYKTTQ